MEDSIQVFIMNISEAGRINDSYCRSHFPLRYERAQKFRFDADRLRSYASGYLLYKILGLEENELQAGEYGKPSAPGKPRFNLSHSGDYTVLAVSDGAVGVDIEQYDPRHVDVADRVFTKKELEWMADDPKERFLVLWTLKEAASKAVGKGLALDFRSFEVLPLIREYRPENNKTEFDQFQSRVSDRMSTRVTELNCLEIENMRLYGETVFSEYADQYALSVVSTKRFERICPEYIQFRT